jgi:hypothetical protein
MTGDPCPSVWGYFPDLPPVPKPLGTTIPNRTTLDYPARGPSQDPPRKWARRFEVKL